MCSCLACWVVGSRSGSELVPRKEGKELEAVLLYFFTSIPVYCMPLEDQAVWKYVFMHLTSEEVSPELETAYAVFLSKLKPELQNEFDGIRARAMLHIELTTKTEVLIQAFVSKDEPERETLCGIWENRKNYTDKQMKMVYKSVKSVIQKRSRPLFYENRKSRIDQIQQDFDDLIKRLGVSGDQEAAWAQRLVDNITHDKLLEIYERVKDE